MIPISFGELLVKYLRMWAKENKTLSTSITNYNAFFNWDGGELIIDMTKTNDFYLKKFFIVNQEKYCDLFAAKLVEPISLFLSEADFTTARLRISFRYVGKYWSRSVEVSPLSPLKIVR